MILLVQNSLEYETDLRAMIGAFFPATKIVSASPDEVAGFDKNRHNEFQFVFTALYEGNNTRLRIEEKGHVLYSAYAYGDFTDRKRYRNKLKLASYRILSEYTGRVLPWGSLTGMRPTKIATSALEKGKNRTDIIDYYQNTYDTSHEKAGLATTVAIKEQSILRTFNPIRDYCLYIGIPFCPTRCLYCSFAAYPIFEYKTKVKDYINALKQELPYISFLNRHRHLVAIYIGGGTPTSLSEKDLEALLKCVEDTFDLTYLREYTIEAGRPDSVTVEKLEIMKRYGCTRISINPQTMNASTLRTIGRGHTPADIKWAFNEARKAGFKNINMDLIAGLPNESLEDMEYTLSEIRKMNPESVTVHSLAIKRAAELNQQYDSFRETINHDMDKMISLASVTLADMKLKPYYLYRQKNIAGNLENTGYAKEGKECLYNVLIMEEKLDTFAAGAGGITRLISVKPRSGDEIDDMSYELRVDSDDNVVEKEPVNVMDLTAADFDVTRVDRVENVKNIDDYIDRVDEMLERKNAGVEARNFDI
ncbi:MAG: coproporphyrinogen dehydrogenase HemZ [Eubacterium sp.]|nr:coproporphyrinogen dehydrogenase HemZ [Eubacterium sp.]